MQLVNHSSRLTCQTEHIETESTPELVVLRIRNIDAGEDINTENIFASLL